MKKPSFDILVDKIPMRIPKRVIVVSGTAALMALPGGCTSDMVNERQGSDYVSLAQATQVGQCRFRAETTVSVLAKLGFYDRSVTDVDADLLQLARNDAVDLGGDTLVKGARPQVGQETFKVYKCRPRYVPLTAKCEYERIGIPLEFWASQAPRDSYPELAPDEINPRPSGRRGRGAAQPIRTGLRERPMAHVPEHTRLTAFAPIEL